MAQTLAQDARLKLENEKVSGSIRLKGARFDEVLLTKYKQTIEDNSPAVELFAPAKTETAFFAQYGFVCYSYDFCGGSVRSRSSGKTTEMTILEYSANCQRN